MANKEQRKESKGTKPTLSPKEKRRKKIEKKKSMSDC